VTDVEGLDPGDDDATIKATIEQQLAPFVIPGKRAQAAKVVMTTMVSKSHKGPLPAPEDLAAYEQAHQGSAERIFQMTEREQNHRHEQERAIVKGEYLTRIVGQVAALIMAGMLAGLAAFCAYLGEPLAAALVAAIGAAAAAFLQHSRKKTTPPPSPPKPPARRKRK